jgi:hypothetical protein
VIPMMDEWLLCLMPSEKTISCPSTYS